MVSKVTEVAKQFGADNIDSCSELSSEAAQIMKELWDHHCDNIHRRCFDDSK